MSNQTSGERTLGVSAVEFERAVAALSDALRAATPNLRAVLAALQAGAVDSAPAVEAQAADATEGEMMLTSALQGREAQPMWSYDPDDEDDE